MSQIKNEEIIKKHIAVYDYQAAVADTMRPEDTEKYLGILKMAESRIFLDFPAVDKWMKKTGFDCLPVIADLVEIALKKECRIDIGNYVKKTDKGRFWDKDKLNKTEIGKILNSHCKDGFRGGPVYSDHMKILIEKYAKDIGMKTLARELRQVEAKIRNMASHEIISITEERIKELTGFTGKQIRDKIIRFFLVYRHGDYSRLLEIL